MPPELITKAGELEKRLEDVVFTFNGPQAKASREEIPPSPVPLNNRLRAVIYASYMNTSGATQTQLDSYAILSEELPPALGELKSIDQELKKLNNELDALGAPWTPGRVPDWQ